MHRRKLWNPPIVGEILRYLQLPPLSETPRHRVVALNKALSPPTSARGAGNLGCVQCSPIASSKHHHHLPLLPAHLVASYQPRHSGAPAPTLLLKVSIKLIMGARLCSDVAMLSQPLDDCAPAMVLRCRQIFPTTRPSWGVKSHPPPPPANPRPPSLEANHPAGLDARGSDPGTWTRLGGEPCRG
jgi:hypothetical protein